MVTWLLSTSPTLTHRALPLLHWLPLHFLFIEHTSFPPPEIIFSQLLKHLAHSLPWHNTSPSQRADHLISLPPVTYHNLTYLFMFPYSVFTIGMQARGSGSVHHSMAHANELEWKVKLNHYGISKKKERELWKEGVIQGIFLVGVLFAFMQKGKMSISYENSVPLFSNILQIHCLPIFPATALVQTAFMSCLLSFNVIFTLPPVSHCVNPNTALKF